MITCNRNYRQFVLLLDRIEFRPHPSHPDWTLISRSSHFRPEAVGDKVLHFIREEYESRKSFVDQALTDLLQDRQASLQNINE
jgi:hypothetical protein